MECVDRPWGKKVIPVLWIFYVKVDEFGNVTRFEARLVANVCRQIPRIDADEDFAPTSSFGARRGFLSVAARDYEVHQVDIKTAFLHEESKEGVYVTQPHGFENGDLRVVCRLNKALYALKQSPHACHKKLGTEMSAMEFEACKSDAGDYVRRKEGAEPIYILVYVDDLLITCKILGLVNWFKNFFKRKFTIHGLDGKSRTSLGAR